MRTSIPLFSIALALVGYGGNVAFLPPPPEKALAPCCSEYRFVVSGEIEHRVLSAAEREGLSADFAQEVYGKEFTVTLPGLPEGRYTVLVTTAETYFRKSGERRFDVSAGSRKIARDLDLFAVAGYGKPYVLTAELDHAEDSIDGPLAMRFEASRNNATVLGFEVRDAKGAVVAKAKGESLVTLQDRAAAIVPVVPGPVLFRDPAQPTEKRVADLVRRLSLKEKVEGLMDAAPPIDRLGVPGYNYWNECLHGVARAGEATVFPQAIGMAATWNPDLMRRIGDTIATEARAKNNAARAANPRTTPRYSGLTFWTPNINIFRDPRWGRGQETYGEDPFLTSRLAVDFIEGLQGDDPRYVKAMACAKHFAVHSGPEKSRHVFDATPSERDLWETYLPAFEAAVREAKVGIVMSAYNAVDGVPAPANRFLLDDVLRGRWGFKGHVVSDCGAINDVWAEHKYVPTKEQAAAVSLKAGTDLNCGSAYAALVGAVNEGLVSEKEIDVALERVLESRFRLGLFDPPERCAYLRIPTSENDTPAHGALALRAAREAMTLLKNDGTLPLARTKARRIALIGPNADSVPALLGNYNGTPSSPVTLRKALAAEPGVEVTYTKGCPLALKPGSTMPPFNEAIQLARKADVIVFAGGLDAGLEGEEMRSEYAGFDRGDRTRIELPEVQNRLLRTLHATGKPIVFVDLSGSAIAMPWEAENLAAILQAWYPGQAGGTAITDVLFGRTNPAGRLPVTFYRSTEDLPSFESYAMTNRTYRYFRGKPLFPFGHGLSYTRFAYGPPKAKGKKVEISVKNVGVREGDEVVQLYVRRKETDAVRSLAAFRRVSIPRGATRKVILELPASAFRRWDTGEKRYVVDPGTVTVEVGASSGDIRRTLAMKVEG